MIIETRLKVENNIFTVFRDIPAFKKARGDPHRLNN